MLGWINKLVQYSLTRLALLIVWISKSHSGIGRSLNHWSKGVARTTVIWWTFETLWKVLLKHPPTRDRIADLQSLWCKINWNLNFSTGFTFDVQAFHTFCKHLSTPSGQVEIFVDVGHLVILPCSPVVFLSNMFSNHWAINPISKLMIYSWLS